MALTVDHVIVCLPDLEDAVADFEAEHGVTSVAGGRHRSHGTANRLVPLGGSYVELVSVVDSREAEASLFGRWVRSRSTRPVADAIAIATDDIDLECRRLDLKATTMSRPTASGEELRWRLAGIEELVTSGLPFFIQWDVDPALHPGRLPVRHPSGAVALDKVTLWGDLERLTTWVADTSGLELRPGEPKATFQLASKSGSGCR